MAITINNHIALSVTRITVSGTLVTVRQAFLSSLVLWIRRDGIGPDDQPKGRVLYIAPTGNQNRVIIGLDALYIALDGQGSVGTRELGDRNTAVSVARNAIEGFQVIESENPGITYIRHDDVHVLAATPEWIRKHLSLPQSGITEKLDIETAPAPETPLIAGSTGAAAGTSSGGSR